MGRIYNIDELRPLSLFAPDVPVQAVTVEVDPVRTGQFGRGRGRVAEVIMVIQRAGELLLVNKTAYPDGVYRLPTGGVEPGEQPRASALREIHEETGRPVDDAGLLGVVDYNLHLAEAGSAPYVSYVFLTEVGPDFEPASTNGEIDAFRWIPAAQLGQVADRLRRLPTDWIDWGCFRAVSYEFILCSIMQYNQGLRPVHGR